MLEKVWEEKLGILRCIVCSILLDRSSTDDVLQESFARLLQSRKSFSDEREAFKYIRRVVFNTAIDFYRRFRRQLACPVLPSSNSPEHLNPLNLLIREEAEEFQSSLLCEIRKEVDKLPEEQRQALDLVFGRKGKKLREICEEQGIPYSTLRSRMIAGIDQIRMKLKEKGLYHSLEEVKP